jgi:hypothetical protein
MKQILSVVLTLSLISPAYAEKIEDRGAIKIPSKEEVKATKRFEEIVEWKKVRAKKGYILSNDLYYVQKCTPTWDVHVKEFKKENPHVKNPNVISIDEIITVQTCYSEEVKEVAKEDPAPVKQVVEKKKENKKLEIFGLISGQVNKSADGDGNKASQGQGIKLEVGKYFKVSEESKIKASVGVLFNKTSLDDSKEETEKTTATADVSYLMKINEKMSLGPNLGIFTGPGFEDAKNLGNGISGFAGANLDYKLNDKFHLDLKVQNALEGRVNINTTFGLGINF